MTEVAYMVREDWAQRGTAMASQSAVIREWLGDLPLLAATADLRRYEDSNSADHEFVRYLGDDVATTVVAYSRFDKLLEQGEEVDVALVALHPREVQDCEVLRRVVAAGRVARVFAIVWSRGHLVRPMLDGLGAMDLHTGAAASIDPVQLEAAKCMVSEQYNGLDSGNGKDAVVQLVRALSAEGCPLDREAWLRAFFAAGGEFREATKVDKLIREIQNGTRHRVRDRYRPDIARILRERAATA